MEQNWEPRNKPSHIESKNKQNKTCDKEVKNNWGKNVLFNKYGWENWMNTCREVFPLTFNLPVAEIGHILQHLQKLTWNGLKT